MWDLRWRVIVPAALLGAAFLASTPGATWPAGERYGADADAVLQVERTLQKAALASPRWHHKQRRFSRDVHDISYLLEEALKASRASNHSAARDYAQQALRLLQRGVNRGHFRADDVTPVLAVIQRLLPHSSV